MIQAEINHCFGCRQIPISEFPEDAELTAWHLHGVSIELVRDRELTAERNIDLLAHRIPFPNRKRQGMASQRTPVYSIFMCKNLISADAQCIAYKTCMRSKRARYNNALPSTYQTFVVFGRFCRIDTASSWTYTQLPVGGDGR